MVTQTLNTIFTRDLNKLQQKIAANNNGAAIWVVDKGIAN
jgi:hypothetical protein